MISRRSFLTWCSAGFAAVGGVAVAATLVRLAEDDRSVGVDLARPGGDGSVSSVEIPIMEETIENRLHFSAVRLCGDDAARLMAGEPPWEIIDPARWEEIRPGAPYPWPDR